MRPTAGVGVFTLLILAAARLAPAVALDPSFSGDGIAQGPSDGLNIANAVAVQPTGEILTVGMTGSAFSGPSTSVALFRVLADGTPDGSFGTSGVVDTPLPGGANGQGVALQPDGKIVVVGGAGAPTDWMIARYDAAGVLDPTFNTGGLVVASFGPGGARGVVLGPAGDLTVVGSGAIARFDGSGTLDATFGVGGVVTFPTGLDATAIVRQPDGYVVVAGRQIIMDDSDFWLARFAPNGDTDPTFGSGGAVVTSFGTDFDRVIALLLQPDGRLVAAGAKLGDVGLDPAFARYLPDGTLDGTFGSGGLATYATSATGGVAGIARQADGKIVVAGAKLDPSFPLPVTKPTLFRLLVDGSVDASFTIDSASAPVSTSFTDVAIQTDGRIVTAGYFAPPGDSFPYTPTDAAMELRRYFPEGVCGNSVVDAGEQCDDPGDPCCTATTCQFAASFVSCASDGNVCTTDRCDGQGLCTHTAGPDGTGCDDANVCTGPDRCTAGTCVGPTIPIDQLCAVCDSPVGVVVRPRTGCKQTTAPGAAALRVRHTTGIKDRLTWKWRKGEATTLLEFGDPFTGSILEAVREFCVFDESGPTPTLVVATAAEPDTFPTCAAPPCWRAQGSRLVYKSNPPNLFGVTNMTLVAGPTGRAKTSVKAKGPALFTPNFVYAPQPPPFALPLRVQLGARDGACWEATFSSAGVRTNGPAVFQARSD